MYKKLYMASKRRIYSSGTNVYSKFIEVKQVKHSFKTSIFKSATTTI